jgi:hypothetical protein
MPRRTSSSCCLPLLSSLDSNLDILIPRELSEVSCRESLRLEVEVSLFFPPPTDLLFSKALMPPCMPSHLPHDILSGSEEQGAAAAAKQRCPERSLLPAEEDPWSIPSMTPVLLEASSCLAVAPHDSLLGKLIPRKSWNTGFPSPTIMTLIITTMMIIIITTHVHTYTTTTRHSKFSPHQKSDIVLQQPPTFHKFCASGPLMCKPLRSNNH